MMHKPLTTTVMHITATATRVLKFFVNAPLKNAPPMNRCGFRSMSVTLLLLCASVAIMGASAAHFQTTSARPLTIAIVDVRRTTPARNEFRAHVAAAFQATVTETLGSDLAIRPVYVGGRDAKMKLNEGAYDAALIIGEDRPGSLQRLDMVTLCGEMSSEYGPLPVSLVLGHTDASLTDRLRTAFTRMLRPNENPIASTPRTNTPLAQLGG